MFFFLSSWNLNKKKHNESREKDQGKQKQSKCRTTEYVHVICLKQNLPSCHSLETKYDKMPWKAETQKF